MDKIKDEHVIGFKNNLTTNPIKSGLINTEKNETTKEDNFEKKEIVLNEKGMYIFAMKKQIFIVEGKNISGNNYELYKKAAIDYIKEIQKFEKLGIETNVNELKFIKQSEMENKYNELINEHNIIIKFCDTNNMDKYYVD